MIKVLLVDDHEMVRLGVSSYLMIQSDMEVVGEASNGLEGYHKALELRPDINPHGFSHGCHGWN